MSASRSSPATRSFIPRISCAQPGGSWRCHDRARAFDQLRVVTIHVRREIARKIPLDCRVHRAVALEPRARASSRPPASTFCSAIAPPAAAPDASAAVWLATSANPRDAFRVHPEERQRDVAADRVPRDRGALDAQRVEQPRDVAGQRLHQRGTLAGRRLAAPAQIDADDARVAQAPASARPTPCDPAESRAAARAANAAAAGVVVADPAAVDGRSSVVLHRAKLEVAFLEVRGGVYVRELLV